MRIVSLIASATEIVCALGLRDQLVGISHECDYPPDVQGLPVLSEPKVDPRAEGRAIDRAVRDIARQGLSVYRVDTEALERLGPDVIVTQDQCEVCAVSLRDVEAAVCALTLRDTRICSLHPDSLADVERDFRSVGEATGATAAAETLLATFRARLDAVRDRTAGRPRPRVACLEWLDPVMVAGGWIPELVRIAGGEPVIVTGPERFRTVTWDDVAAADPDVVVIMPCGYDEAHSRRDMAGPTVRDALGALRSRVHVVDGNAYFNRPGPRLADSAEILAGLLHPGASQ